MAARIPHHGPDCARTYPPWSDELIKHADQRRPSPNRRVIQERLPALLIDDTAISGHGLAALGDVTPNLKRLWSAGKGTREAAHAPPSSLSVGVVTLTTMLVLVFTAALLITLGAVGALTDRWAHATLEPARPIRAQLGRTPRRLPTCPPAPSSAAPRRGECGHVADAEADRVVRRSMWC